MRDPWLLTRVNSRTFTQRVFHSSISILSATCVGIALCGCLVGCGIPFFTDQGQYANAVAVLFTGHIIEVADDYSWVRIEVEHMMCDGYSNETLADADVITVNVTSRDMDLASMDEAALRGEETVEVYAYDQYVAPDTVDGFSLTVVDD